MIAWQRIPVDLIPAVQKPEVVMEQLLKELGVNQYSYCVGKCVRPHLPPPPPHDAKAFYHQQEESVRKSYKELSGALKERYEGGLALLKYKKV